ncbi:MAG: FitA-like ribbon-helix-helix domain-containing protein [Bryobacteraceae bacterium]
MACAAFGELSYQLQSLRKAYAGHFCMLMNMSKLVRIRDLPDQAHSTLKVRAAREGMSLSDFIKRELERTAARPSMQEWLERTRQAKPILARRSPAQIVRQLRDSQ